MIKFLTRIPVAICLVFISLMVFAAAGFAADAVVDPTPSSSLLDLLKPVGEAFAGGHYAYAAALVVILMVALVKRYLGTAVPWFHTDAGGSTLALVASSAGAVATALAVPGATVSLSLLKTALLVGVGAAGGFSIVKALLIEPLLKPLEAKAPAWLKPIFSIVFWIFDKPDPIAIAEAAGAAAVAASPAPGLPTPTDVK